MEGCKPPTFVRTCNKWTGKNIRRGKIFGEKSIRRGKKYSSGKKVFVGEKSIRRGKKYSSGKKVFVGEKSIRRGKKYSSGKKVFVGEKSIRRGKKYSSGEKVFVGGKSIRRGNILSIFPDKVSISDAISKQGQAKRNQGIPLRNDKFGLYYSPPCVHM